MRQNSIYCPKFIFILLSLFVCNVASAQNVIDNVQETYCYPSPSSSGISIKTSIGIRYSEALNSSALEEVNLTVIGESSGLHSGKITLSVDRLTLIFTPNIPFSSAEEVHISIKPLDCISGKRTAPYLFTFQTSKSSVDLRSLLSRQSANQRKELSPVASQPWLESSNSDDTLPADFPKIYVTESHDPAPGNIYLANFKFTNNYTGAYLIIIDNQGNVLFERSMAPDYAEGFRPQPNKRYTYFDHDVSRYKFYEMDSNFVVVDSIEAANGYLTDGHELIFLPGGGYALIAMVDEQVNMTKYINTGDSNTTVIEGIVQEFDAKKHLIFEWLTRDHFSFLDPTEEALSVPFLDFTHCNSLENDGDTAFILSSRNLDEVTKISRKDGHIIWRWGGKNNQFKFVNDSLIFAHQHYVKRLANGNILMFDNNFPPLNKKRYSRAVEYHLDEESKIATDVWEYHHNPEMYCEALGSVQQLPNGNRLIGWGGGDSVLVAVTEVKPDGSTALEIKFDPQIYSYRAYKFTEEELNEGVPSQVSAPSLSLDQNYPNPFSASSIINFHVDTRTTIELVLYDALGREVKILFNGTVDPGSYTAKCDADRLPSGAYFYKLSTPTTSLTRAMFISK